MIHKLTDQEAIRIAHKAWPKILGQIRKNKQGERTKILPASISNNKYLNNTRPYISLPTSGCIHHLRGGCTMCSFNVRRPQQMPKVNFLKESIDKAVDYYIKANAGNKSRYYFGIGTGGSFFDPTEIPPMIRRYLYKKLKEAVPVGVSGVVMVESRLEFVNEPVLAEAKDFLGNKFLIALGYGVESMNRVIREACIHKKLPSDWQEKTELLKQHQINRIAHVVVKPPFISEDEAVDDVVSSVRELFKKQFCESVIVMVMAVKRNTVVEVLKKNEEYALPSIWSIIRIIKALGPEVCRRVTFNGFAWTPEQEAIITQSSKRSNLVRGCAQCSPVLMPHLLSLKEPNTIEQWQRLMWAAKGLGCKCKTRYYQKRVSEELYYDFNRRIIKAINRLSLQTTRKSLSVLIKEKINI